MATAQVEHLTARLYSVPDIRILIRADILPEPQVHVDHQHDVEHHALQRLRARGPVVFFFFDF
ncbi:hypothetical protein, partial [Pseudoxanthomonas japonensis]|uniref:hypothetical protein n=1 Tax=Pseudoxanthomonas japonensis TaxID=69284 RepID=UPI001EE498F3